jgi:hypothetical protein
MGDVGAFAASSRIFGTLVAFRDAYAFHSLLLFALSALTYAVSASSTLCINSVSCDDRGVAAADDVAGELLAWGIICAPDK